jgi:hypothetical protein
MKKCTISAGVLSAFFSCATIAWSQGGMYATRGADGKMQIVDRGGIPMWEYNPKFKDDVFTFVRIEYSSERDFYRSASAASAQRGVDLLSPRPASQFDVFAQRGRGGRRGGRGFGGGWATDYPEADLNFSYRLQQLTSLKVNPVPIVLRLTDPELFDYPFIYMIEVYSGRIRFTNEEAAALRRYLENGGFLMVDDFWGDYAWEWFYDEIKRVFPTREPVELPIEHEIFHCVYNIKEKPQVPAISSLSPEQVARGITWELRHGPGVETPHYRGIFDDKGRLMVIICHNTDIGDGWEREGYDEWYFHEFCENKSYPMGINIVTYALTH